MLKTKALSAATREVLPRRLQRVAAKPVNTSGALLCAYHGEYLVGNVRETQEESDFMRALANTLRGRARVGTDLQLQIEARCPPRC